MTPAHGTLILVRHGETDLNAGHRFQGHSDTPLSARGHAQAQALAAHLGSLALPRPVVYSSDLRRAAQTAEPVGRALGAELHLSPALREIHVGRWEGQPMSDLAEQDAVAWARFWSGDPHASGPGGETPQAVAERTHAFALAHWPPAGHTHVFVFHGLALTALLSRLLGRDYQDLWQSRDTLHDNAAYSRLRVGPAGVVLESQLARRDHLGAVPT